MIATASPKSLTRWAAWLLALVLGLSLAARTWAADADDKGQLFATVPVPAGLSSGEVSDAIVATLMGRQWGVKSKSDGQVIGYLKHRSNEATVTMFYDTSKVDIYCVGYQIDKTTGTREKPEQPKGWLKNLQSDLTKRFNKAVTHK